MIINEHYEDANAMNQILIMLRGLPGAGKSTAASFVSGDHPVFEADSYFVGDDGVYRFDKSLLPQAHAACQQAVRCALEAGEPIVYVSNTSTQDWEVAQYQEIATDCGAAFVSMLVENRHGGSSAHDVPQSSVESMRDRFDVSL